jgi:hypothetical protein
MFAIPPVPAAMRPTNTRGEGLVTRVFKMVVRYAHPTEEHQFAAMKKLEAFRMAK